MTVLAAVRETSPHADEAADTLAAFFALAGCDDAARRASELLADQRFGAFLTGSRWSADRLGLDADAVHATDVLRRAIRAVLRRDIEHRPVLSTYAALTDYLHATLADEPVETLHVLFLDCRNHLIADEEFARGTVDHVAIYPRRIMRRALELEASAVILVHNHPSGDPSPSEGDMEATRQVADAGRTLGVALHDHIIVGRQGHRSLLHPPATQPRRWFARKAA